MSLFMGYGRNDDNDPPETFGPPRPMFIAEICCRACGAFTTFDPPRMFVSATIRTEKCSTCKSDSIALLEVARTEVE